MPRKIIGNLKLINKMSKYLKGSMNQNWNFQRDRRNPFIWEGYGFFLDQYNNCQEQE